MLVRSHHETASERNMAGHALSIDNKVRTGSYVCYVLEALIKVTLGRKDGVVRYEIKISIYLWPVRQ